MSFKKLYDDQIKNKLMQEFKYKNIMQVPRLKKITLNMGVGEAVSDKKILTAAVNDLTQISGQKPVVTLSRKSISTYKVREGWPIGCKVTLRGQRMYDFLERLIRTVIPRIRDFRGLSARSFDGRGNYSFGLKEQIVFPEIDYDQIDAIRGLDITFTTSANSNQEAYALLKAYGFPFKEVAVA